MQRGPYDNGNLQSHPYSKKVDKTGKDSLLELLKGGSTPLAPPPTYGFQNTSHQDSERTNILCFKPFSLWSFVTVSLET
jgi:hypothetical protein